MHTGSENSGSNGFFIGLVAGGVVGAALAIAFAPKLASELRRRVAASAADITHAAADWRDAAEKGYQEVNTRIAGVVDSVTARGQTARDHVADAVGRGAREVEQFAMASKTVPEPRRS